MKFSLINIQGRIVGNPFGAWIQNHIGTLESATQSAIDIEEANSNKIDVAVMEQSAEGMPFTVYDVKRLDTRRNAHGQ